MKHRPSSGVISLASGSLSTTSTKPSYPTPLEDGRNTHLQILNRHVLFRLLGRCRARTQETRRQVAIHSTYPLPLPQLSSPLARTNPNQCYWVTGLQSHTVSLETQTAEVEVTDLENPSYETVLEKIKKTGKTVKGGWVDGDIREV